MSSDCPNPHLLTEPAAEDRAVAPGPARVRADSHLTLHYRLTLKETGADIINTFEGKPATLQLGIGQMAEPLECYEPDTFVLQAGEADQLVGVLQSNDTSQVTFSRIR